MNWEYLAGFTDADGCISIEISKDRYPSCRVRWAQKESESLVLDLIAEFLLENGITATNRQFSVSRLGHKYPQRELGITNASDALVVLTNLLPYLIVKQDRAMSGIAVLQFVKDLKIKYGNKYRMHMTEEEWHSLSFLNSSLLSRKGGTPKVAQRK